MGKKKSAKGTSQKAEADSKLGEYKSVRPLAEVETKPPEAPASVSRKQVGVIPIPSPLEPPDLPSLFEFSDRELIEKAAAVWRSSYETLDLLCCAKRFNENDTVLKNSVEALLIAQLRSVDRLVRFQLDGDGQDRDHLRELTNRDWTLLEMNLKAWGTEYKPYDGQPRLDEWLLTQYVCLQPTRQLYDYLAENAIVIERNAYVPRLEFGFDHVNKVLSWMAWVGAILLDRHRRAKIVPADNVHENLASLHEKAIALCLESRLLYDAHHIEYTGTLNYVPSFAKWFGDKHRALKEGVKTLEEGLLALDPPPIKHIAMTIDLLTLAQEVVTQNGVDYPFTSEGRDGLIARCRRDLQTEAKAWRPTAVIEKALPKAESPMWHESEMKLYYKGGLVAELHGKRGSQIHKFIEAMDNAGWPSVVEFRDAWPRDANDRSNRAKALNRTVQFIRFGYARNNPNSLTWSEKQRRTT